MPERVLHAPRHSFLKCSFSLTLQQTEFPAEGEGNALLDQAAVLGRQDAERMCYAAGHDQLAGNADLQKPSRILDSLIPQGVEYAVTI